MINEENENDKPLSDEEYQKIKLNLEDLTNQYLSLSNEITETSFKLSEIRYKINICLDLIASYTKDKGLDGINE